MCNACCIKRSTMYVMHTAQETNVDFMQAELQAECRARSLPQSQYTKAQMAESIVAYQQEQQQQEQQPQQQQQQPPQPNFGEEMAQGAKTPQMMPEDAGESEVFDMPANDAQTMSRYQTDIDASRSVSFHCII